MKSFFLTANVFVFFYPELLKKQLSLQVFNGWEIYFRQNEQYDLGALKLIETGNESLAHDCIIVCIFLFPVENYTRRRTKRQQAEGRLIIEALYRTGEWDWRWPGSFQGPWMAHPVTFKVSCRMPSSKRRPIITKSFKVRRTFSESFVSSIRKIHMVAR